MLVTFTRKVPPYNAGETAGFPDNEAKRFIRQGVATAKTEVVEEAPSVVRDGVYATTAMPDSQVSRKVGRKGR